MHTEQQDSLIQSMQTILLVVIESLLTLVLRFDSKLRQSVYPLAVEGSVLAIRSYLPHDVIYLTFSFKGVLIDSELPNNKQAADVTINANSFEIINAIISNQPHVIDKLQFRGEPDKIVLVKDFLQNLSVNQLLENIVSRFLNKKTSESDTETQGKKDKTSSKDKSLKIKALQAEKQELKIINKKQATQIAEMQNIKKLYIGLSVLTFILGLLVSWLIFK